MNGRASQLLESAAAFRGELHRMLLALGIVMGIALLSLAVLWAIEEWRVRKLPVALGWFGIACIALVAVVGLGLLFAGLL